MIFWPKAVTHDNNILKSKNVVIYVKSNFYTSYEAAVSTIDLLKEAEYN